MSDDFDHHWAHCFDITECNDDGTVHCVLDGIFDGRLLGPELDTVVGTLLGSNNRSNLGIPLGTSEGTEDCTNDVLHHGDQDGILRTVSLLL